MSTTPDIPSTAEIREFLSRTFTDDELMDFCYDYFRGAYDSFGTRITKGQRIQLLIEYCEKHAKLPELGRALEKARPDQYDKLFSKSQPPPFNPALPISDKPDAPRPGTGRSLSTTVTITIGTVAATVLLALFALVVNKVIRLQSEKPIATQATEAQLIAAMPSAAPTLSATSTIAPTGTDTHTPAPTSTASRVPTLTATPTGMATSTLSPTSTRRPPTSTPIPTPSGVTSAELTAAAWKALAEGQHDKAVELTRQCIGLFESQAVQQQQSLASPPPVGVVTKADEQSIAANWALNDVATSYWILGQALEKLGRVDEAIDAYTSVRKYPYARTWDLAGWFWSPADAASKRLSEL